MNKVTAAITAVGKYLPDYVLTNQELETIKQIGSALASSTFDINKVLKYTMDMVRMLMNVEAGSLLFLENDELELAVAFNTKLQSMKKFKLKILMLSINFHKSSFWTDLNPTPTPT